MTEGTISTSDKISLEPTGHFKWRAVVINPTWIGRQSLRMRWQRFWGSDIFMGKPRGWWVKIPLLKATIVLNIIITVAIVKVLT